MFLKIGKRITYQFNNFFTKSSFILGSLLETEKNLAKGISNARKNTKTEVSISDTAHVQILQNILNKENKTIYLREYDYLGFYSCHMIVPDFSEIYPLEDMIYNNKNQGKLIRDFILNNVCFFCMAYGWHYKN